jgi:hypothetical protein
MSPRETLATSSSRRNSEALATHVVLAHPSMVFHLCMCGLRRGTTMVVATLISYNDVKVAAETTTRRRRSWSTTSSIPTQDYVGSLLHLAVRLVVTIHDLLLASILWWHGRSSASIPTHKSTVVSEPPCIVLSLDHALWWYVMVIRGWCGLRHVTERLVHTPSMLCVHIVSRLSQKIEVICSDLLLINVIDLVKIEAFWIAQIWVDLINPMRFS